MKIEHFETDSATYQIHRNVVAEGMPYTVFLHGGPGFNSYGERQVLGPLLHSELNFLWFDLLGCADAPAKSPDKITWARQIDDIAAIIQEFARGPVNVIGHCLGSHLTHDLVRDYKKLVRSVVWYSPVNRLSDLFKGILTRSFLEERLNPVHLTENEKITLAQFSATPEELFGHNEVMTILFLAGRIREFQELYWSDPGAMKKYIEFMTEKPFSPEVYVRLQSDFFGRGPRPMPSYQGIPVLMLHSDNDKVVPWKANGKALLDHIPHAETRLIKDACHWIHFQKPEEVAKATLQFLQK